MSASGESSFLWKQPPEPPAVERFTPRGEAWWRQYADKVGLPPAALREVAKSSREIVGLLPDPQAWGSSASPFKGLVVGAVQSGKTGSMMGVTATAIDHGYRIVVVLAGLKEDLRQQTARRFNAQLLHQSDEIPGTAATTLGRPRGPGPLGGFAPPFPYDVNQYRLLLLHMTRALDQGEPCVIVVKKTVRSLIDMRNALASVYRKLGADKTPTLILDDECDDASVGASEGLPIPTAISGLWRIEGLSPRTSYVGYTATAAANLLQDVSGELYPTHFAYLLRYPSSDDATLSFADPDPDAWYTGGETFYEEFGDEPGERSPSGNFLAAPVVEEDHLRAPPQENPSLREALRAYFIAGAIRLALDPRRSFNTPALLPEPHAMLIHTAATKADHARWAGALRALFAGRDAPDRSIALAPTQALALLGSEEDAWRAWFDRFERSRERVHRERSRARPFRFLTWESVKALLPEVFTHTRIRVVNSDDEVGSTLDFEPGLDLNGQPIPPRDVYVIVIGGSKLSRGITVKGLCISYFARWTPNPREDTVQQMSRWFGYRGRHLEFCRLFTSPLVLENLKEMHFNDTDLRYQLAELMAERIPPADATISLTANPRAVPTGKMGEATRYTPKFSPYTAVLSYLEVGAHAATNEDRAARLTKEIRARDARTITTVTGSPRGILSSGWAASEVADLLDSFSFSFHNPDPSTRPLREFYRPQVSTQQPSIGIPVLYDPYQLAAFLRNWQKEDPASVPTFNVGVAYGDMAGTTAPFDFPLSNKQITPEGRLVGGWTGRSSTWRGDAFFDDPPSQLRVRGSQRRLAGCSGLVLLYVIHKDAQGREGRGIARSNHTPALGLAIPGGGPEVRVFMTAPPEAR